MRRNLIALGFFLLAVSCNSNKSNADTGYDMSKFEPPVIAKSDTQALATVGVLSVDELKDDSVFADGSIPTSWENAGVRDVQALKLFLKQLQQLVIVNDKTGLADHVQYPLKDITSKEKLIRRYDEIFTKDVKLSLATLNFNQLFRNQDGVMTTGGKLWVRQVGPGFKIIAINN